jgi:hypothetical protein
MTAANKPLTIFRVRLQCADSACDDDNIRRLRAALKLLLRRFHFRVIEIEQEQTPSA